MARRKLASMVTYGQGNLKIDGALSKSKEVCPKCENKSVVAIPSMGG